MKRSVMAGPVPAIYATPAVVQMAGTSPAMTDRFIRSNDGACFVPPLNGGAIE